MKTTKVPGMKPCAFVCIVLAAAVMVLLQAPKPAIAEDDMVTQATLLDRIQIEDLLVKYYYDLTSGEGHDLAQYFAEDAVLDVNGMIAKGRKTIEEMYSGFDEDEANLGSKMHMLLTNPVIRVDGDTAKAWVIWTGVMNDNIRLAPRLMEQGREYTELVKLDGRWLIKKRYISADSGMPAIWDDTYEPREHK